jgi:hypothetical protein
VEVEVEAALLSLLCAVGEGGQSPPSILLSLLSHSLKVGSASPFSRELIFLRSSRRIFFNLLAVLLTFTFTDCEVEVAFPFLSLNQPFPNFRAESPYHRQQHYGENNE